MAAADYAYTHYRDRLLSLRLDPAGHPYPEDGVERLRLQLESRTSALSVLGMRFAPLRRLKIGLLARLPVPLLRWANPRMTRLRRALTFRLSGRNRFALMAPRGVRRGAHWRSVPGALGDKLDRRVPE